MAKFAPERFPPGFFDLTQDIARAVPPALLEPWINGERTAALATQLLEPYRVSGIAVSSDAAGLTRLSGARGLYEILAMLNRPKELVHAYGRALGGESIGIWAADNTQMLYPATLRMHALLEALLAAQDRIAAECEVSFGLGVHRGDFFRIGDGLYGDDADRVELLAEEYTSGGEIVLTGEAAAALGDDHAFELYERDDLPEDLGACFRVIGGPRATDLDPRDTEYPIPYSARFHAGLSKYRRSRGDLSLADVKSVEAARECAVVLVDREREVDVTPEMAILNELALSVAMTRVGSLLAREHGGVEVKTVGSIGLYTFDDAEHAVAFARAVRAQLAEQGIATRTGVDWGPVLVFDLDAGGRDIAGMAVNVASKLAQDVGSWGALYVTERIASRLSGAASFAPAHFEVSGVRLDVRVG